MAGTPHTKFAKDKAVARSTFVMKSEMTKTSGPLLTASETEYTEKTLECTLVGLEFIKRVRTEIICRPQKNPATKSATLMPHVKDDVQTQNMGIIGIV